MKNSSQNFSNKFLDAFFICMSLRAPEDLSIDKIINRISEAIPRINNQKKKKIIKKMSSHIIEKKNSHWHNWIADLSHLVLNVGADIFAFNLTGGIVRIFPILFVELNDVVSDVLCRAALLVELEALFELFCWCCWCCFCSWRHFALLFLNQTF